MTSQLTVCVCLYMHVKAIKVVGRAGKKMGTSQLADQQDPNMDALKDNSPLPVCLHVIHPH